MIRERMKNNFMINFFLAVLFFINLCNFSESAKDESSADSFKINIDGIKEKLWGEKADISDNSSAAKPEKFNLDKGIYIKENINNLYIGIEVDPDIADGQRVSELQILLNIEGKDGGEDDPYNFDAERLVYKGMKPSFVIPIQWDSNNGGKIISAGFVKWDADSKKWIYGDLSGNGGKIGAGGASGVGLGDGVSKITKENTWLEISISKSNLGSPEPNAKINLAALLKSDSRSSGICACIPKDDALVSDYGNAKGSQLNSFSTYMMLANPLPQEVKKFSTYLMSVIDFFSQWCIPLIIFFICTYAYFKKVKVYEVFVSGAKEGFNVAVMIIPYLVAILFAIGMFRAGGAEQIFTDFIKPMTGKLGIPGSVIPLMIIRPLSGGGARGVMLDIFKQYGPDSLDGLIASCIQGSTETTFYVIAVYLGSVGIRRTRYAVPACLIGDIIGFISSVIICNWIFGAGGLR